MPRRRVTMVIAVTMTCFIVSTFLLSTQLKAGGQTDYADIPRRPLLTLVPETDISVFSVVAISTNHTELWDRLAVNAWLEHGRYPALNCCYLLRGGRVLQLKPAQINQRVEMFNLTAQVECENPSMNEKPPYPHGVIITSSPSCPHETNYYVTPVLPKTPSGSFKMAVCAKIAYGNLDANLTVEWMEYNRYMGVSHVTVFTYKLNHRAQTVLDFYEKLGFVEQMPFSIPHDDVPGFDVGDKSLTSWNDEQVTVYDCQARLRQYDYVAVVDFDEFIIPLVDNGFKDLMNRVLHNLPTTAAVKFYSEQYVLDWNKDSPSGELIITQYNQRTESTDDEEIDISQRKWIHMPRRVLRGTCVTHGCLLDRMKQYVILKDPVEILAMNHYRGCVFFRDDCFKRRRVKDNRIQKHARNIVHNVREVQKKLFLLTSTT